MCGNSDWVELAFWGRWPACSRGVPRAVLHTGHSLTLGKPGRDRSVGQSGPVGTVASPCGGEAGRGQNNMLNLAWLCWRTPETCLCPTLRSSRHLGSTA